MPAGGSGQRGQNVVAGRGRPVRAAAHRAGLDGVEVVTTWPRQGRTVALRAPNGQLPDLRREVAYRRLPGHSLTAPSAADPWMLVVCAPDVPQRSRPIADAFGAPVLREEDRIGRPGTARPINASVEGLLASQRRLEAGCHLRRGRTDQLTGTLAFTVVSGLDRLMLAVMAR
jgi:hypothetical protein